MTTSPLAACTQATFASYIIMSYSTQGSPPGRKLLGVGSPAFVTSVGGGDWLHVDTCQAGLPDTVGSSPTSPATSSCRLLTLSAFTAKWRLDADWRSSMERLVTASCSSRIRTRWLRPLRSRRCRGAIRDVGSPSGSDISAGCAFASTSDAFPRGDSSSLAATSIANSSPDFATAPTSEALPKSVSSRLATAASVAAKR